MYVLAQDNNYWNLETADGIKILVDNHKSATYVVLHRTSMKSDDMFDRILATLEFVGGRSSRPIAELLVKAIHLAMEQGTHSVSIQKILDHEIDNG